MKEYLARDDPAGQGDKAENREGSNAFSTSRLTYNTQDLPLAYAETHAIDSFCEPIPCLENRLKVLYGQKSFIHFRRGSEDVVGVDRRARDVALGVIGNGAPVAMAAGAR